MLDFAIVEQVDDVEIEFGDDTIDKRCDVVLRVLPMQIHILDAVLVAIAELSKSLQLMKHKGVPSDYIINRT